MLLQANDLSTIDGCKRILEDADEEEPADATYDDLLLLAAATVKRRRQGGSRLTNGKLATEEKVLRAITVSQFIRLSGAIEAGAHASATVDVQGTLAFLPDKVMVKRCGRGGGKLFGCKKQITNNLCSTCSAHAGDEAYYEWLFELTIQDWDNESVSVDILAVVKGGTRAQTLARPHYTRSSTALSAFWTPPHLRALFSHPHLSKGALHPLHCASHCTSRSLPRRTAPNHTTPHHTTPHTYTDVQAANIPMCAIGCQSCMCAKPVQASPPPTLPQPHSLAQLS